MPRLGHIGGETYVGMVVGDRVLEGYIDLVYHNEESGLVVVN